ncbi:hypothetical protein NLY43_29120 [Mesorhizobium sp. C416B]|uniref:hypothetical protein n=1 Tax=unclassified Mesorhizobium TaxID=325217 RepID=UPI0003CF61C5|nr:MULTISPECIES: hypothetical protein [unclassified Mesorhizobium]ESX45404.1 hypothetical protein X762_26010 [Mesorhizobium sp. LSHC426A00]WJI62600.1 hypothetical protein NLY43_29120 [Mesorhizobium sp. C416B]
MVDRFAREFLKFEVSETSDTRGYWLDQPWIESGQRPGLIKASILALPLTDGDEKPVFPIGTGDFVERFRNALGTEATLAVAIRNDEYQELALHSKAWRIPTLLLTVGVLPVALNIFSNRLDELLPGHKSGDTAELTLIVEGPNNKALKLYYKGDSHQLGPMLNTAIPRFIEELNEPQAAPHQVHPRKRARHSAH